MPTPIKFPLLVKQIFDITQGDRVTGLVIRLNNGEMYWTRETCAKKAIDQVVERITLGR